MEPSPDPAIGPSFAERRASAETRHEGARTLVATVLVVDDERKIRDLVRSYLEREGYTVLETGSGGGAIDIVRRLQPDLVVLDLGLPDLPGEDVVHALRRGGDVPVVMLTARASEGDRVAGLRLGADDYVTKPFSPRELVARVEAVLRRSRGPVDDHPPTYAGGRLVIDHEGRDVVLDDDAVALTRTEFDLLAALASRPGRAWSRYELVNRVQGYDYEGYERTVDAHVKNLRRKLRDDPRNPEFVLTVPGIGYKFGPAADG